MGPALNIQTLNIQKEVSKTGSLLKYIVVKYSRKFWLTVKILYVVFLSKYTCDYLY